MASEKPFLRRAECSASGCRWPPAKAAPEDVNGDGRSDLVTVDSDGTAHVFRGTANGIEATASADSLTEQVDPALYDGGGHYLIDTADVSGDGRADLITIKGSGGVYVHRGRANRTFAPAIEAIDASLKPVMNGTGSFEPVGVIDLNDDGRGDLVGLDHASSHLSAFFGQANGTFLASGARPDLTVDSALLDGRGDYLIDLVDSNRFNGALLVTMSNQGTPAGPRPYAVYADGESSGTYGTFFPASQAAVNPIFDDGSGEEPVGLADLNADGNADLLTLDGTTLKLRTGDGLGLFARSATTAYAGSIDSSLLDGRGEELVGLFDYDRDRRADLVSVNDDG
ncbi:MAG TPA: VCBS repeat-containing protein, partial [Solirubrobacterales bacterium]|nr:VCBS repeat-containing protein [Solirubrobacterales bacterium]